jgi:hypothetical protein
MGIDAKMLIRYRGERPTDFQLTKWSWDLCRSIGAKHFFIYDGMEPDSYRAANEAWHAAFNSHPLYEQWKNTRRSDAYNTIRSEVGEPPKEMCRAIELTHRRYPCDDEDVPESHRAPGLAWTQDGDPILANPGETFLDVSLWTRYYGEGYERGDILTICAIAEWIEQNINPSEVWYGGDSSGVLAAPFGAAQRNKHKALLYSQRGRDYFNYGERGGFPTPKPCGLCVPDTVGFTRHGWGDSYIAVSCAGCGKNFESRDDGKTWTEPKR